MDYLKTAVQNLQDAKDERIVAKIEALLKDKEQLAKALENIRTNLDKLQAGEDVYITSLNYSGQLSYPNTASSVIYTNSGRV